MKHVCIMLNHALTSQENTNHIYVIEMKIIIMSPLTMLSWTLQENKKKENNNTCTNI